MTTRYALRPRPGEHLHLSDEESWPILEVHDNGRRIAVVDRIGRRWDLQRAEKGCWLVDLAQQQRVAPGPHRSGASRCHLASPTREEQTQMTIRHLVHSTGTEADTDPAWIVFDLEAWSNPSASDIADGSLSPAEAAEQLGVELVRRLDDYEYQAQGWWADDAYEVITRTMTMEMGR